MTAAIITPPQDAPQLRHRPGQSAIDADRSDGAILATRPNAERLFRTIQGPCGLGCWEYSARFQRQRGELNSFCGQFTTSWVC